MDGIDLKGLGQIFGFSLDSMASSKIKNRNLINNKWLRN
tara:strand:+ start:1818 stop:1934 length:117 start_codon:yes stop_codon:yes gene_type:complete